MAEALRPMKVIRKGRVSHEPAIAVVLGAELKKGLAGDTATLISFLSRARAAEQTRNEQLRRAETLRKARERALAAFREALERFQD
jgi:hypothetical protein